MGPTVTLADGYTISRIIKGGWQLAGGHGTIDPNAAMADMAAFVRAGINTFDCADIYTGVEKLIGQFRASPAGSTVRVHTKCVPDLTSLPTLTPGDITRTIDRSRQRLGVDTLDLVQFHWWDYSLGDVVKAARHLATLRDDGAIEHLGATNFSTRALESLYSQGVRFRTHQVQYSLLDRRPAHTMGPWCVSHDVALLCYGALAGGFFHERWIGAHEPCEPFENRSLAKYMLIINEAGGWEAFQNLLRSVAQVAERNQVTIGSVAIAWVLAQPGVAAVIVGARNVRHLAPTVSALTLSLGERDLAIIAGALSQLRIPPGDVYDLERERDGPHGRLMRYNLNSN